MNSIPVEITAQVNEAGQVSIMARPEGMPPVALFTYPSALSEQSALTAVEMEVHSKIMPPPAAAYTGLHMTIDGEQAPLMDC